MRSLKKMSLPELLDVCLDMDIPAEERALVREHVASLLPVDQQDLNWEQQLCLKIIANPPTRTGKPMEVFKSDYVTKET